MSVMLEGEGTGDGHPRRKLVDEEEVPPKPKKSNAKPPRNHCGHPPSKHVTEERLGNYFCHVPY